MMDVDGVVANDLDAVNPILREVVPRPLICGNGSLDIIARHEPHRTKSGYAADVGNAGCKKYGAAQAS